MKETFKSVFENRVLQYIKKRNLVKPQSCIVVALSGGSDSVCLINALKNIKVKLNISLIACHVNHMIRANQADSDEKFCEQLCKRLDILFVAGKFDVPKIAKEQKKSIELAARDVRYEFLKKVCSKYGAEYLATAHNQNDNAETMTANFIRGSGLCGLCGIDVCRKDENINIIRPILCMDRQDILLYLKEIGENYVTDYTNFETDCTRNKIRLELIKYIKENLNPNFCKTVTASAESIENDNDFVEKEVLKHTKECIFKDGKKIFIQKSALNQLHSAIRYRIIRKAVECVRNTTSNIGIDAVKKIDTLKTGSCDISGGLKVYISYDRIYFDMGSNEKKEKYNYDYAVNETLYIKEADCSINSKIITQLPKKRTKNSVYFDYDLLKDKKIVFRTRENGDVLHTEVGRKKVKDIFIDMKIPIFMRNKIPIMECDGEILWICALRRTDKYKISEDTKNVLQITYTGEDKR